MQQSKQRTGRPSPTQSLICLCNFLKGSHLLRLLARCPGRLAPLLTLLLVLRSRFFRLTGEGLDSEEEAAFALGFPLLPESLESDTVALAFLLAPVALAPSLESESAGLAAALEPFFTSGLLESDAAGLAFASVSFLALTPLSESLAAGLFPLLGLSLLSEGAGLLALAGGCLLSFGPASSESEEDTAFLSGLSAFTCMQSTSSFNADHAEPEGGQNVH